MKLTQFLKIRINLIYLNLRWCWIYMCKYHKALHTFSMFSNKTCLTEKIQKVSKTFTIMSMIDVFSLQCLYNTYIYITLNNTYIFKNSLWRLKINIVVCFFSSYKIYQRFKFALISYILKSFCCNFTNII